MTATTPTEAAGDVAAARILGWDCIEFWVGNARATAGFFLSAFGFTNTGYAGPETGRRDMASYVLEQGEIRLVISGALDPDSPIAKHVQLHGDGVHDLAWIVDDVDTAYEAAIARGGRSIREPWSEYERDGGDGAPDVVSVAGSVDEVSDEVEVLRLATIGTYGETQHTFVDRSRYHGASLAPGYDANDLLPDPVGPSVGLARIDHVVGNVEQGALERWVDFYSQVLGFDQLTHFDDEQISTEYSALMSTVMYDGSKIVLPINEPADGRRKSQIQEYLDAYHGPGVQHLALATDDIVTTVAAMRDRGVRFMTVPDAYYDEARVRMEGVDLPWDDLKRLNILVDRDHEGHLLQIFTEPIMDRPTVFFEIIERRGAKGFGEGNFKALFEAIERDQARRGNL